MLISSEESEKEGKLCLLKELVLRPLTVKVHRVAYNVVGYRRVHQEGIRLCMAMTEEKHFYHV